jgi:membrane protease subunit HflC
MHVQRLVAIVLAIVLISALLALTVTFTVRFTETGVLTTFGKAEEGAIKNEPGLYFKWPFPIQSVTKYDKRLRFVQTRLETAQTSDGSQIIVEGFATYRVNDPLRFFQRFSNAGERADEHFKKAEGSISDSLRSSLGATSRYAMGDLFSTTEAGSKLPELEADVLRLIRQSSVEGGSLNDFGIEVASVGINRVILPQETTAKVFDRMRANREALVKDIEGQGEATAVGIRSRAQEIARQIESFATRRAEEIRALGDQEASVYVAEMNQNPQLAVFLREVEFLKSTYTRKVTLILPDNLPGIRLLNQDATENVMRQLQQQRPTSPTTPARPGSPAADGRTSATPEVTR